MAVVVGIVVNCELFVLLSSAKVFTPLRHILLSPTPFHPSLSLSLFITCTNAHLVYRANLVLRLHYYTVSYSMTDSKTVEKPGSKPH